MIDVVTAEIEELHRFFVDWFNGRCTEDAFSERFLARMSDDFEMVVPSGKCLPLPALTEGLRGGYASSYDFDIIIRHVSILHESPTTVCARYQELQTRSRRGRRGRNARWSTVLFERDGDGLRWRWVHETDIPVESLPVDAFGRLAA